MNEKVATTLLHYVEKGGRFYRKEDLLRIYGLDSALYAELEPYIRIAPSSGNNELNSKRPADISAVPTIELNTADTADLLPLKGIGPVLARRVLKYRNLLGGFTTKDQLLEVYGISEEVFRELSSAVWVDTLFIEKMDLNHATYAEFLRHPYFDRELANAILAYRKKQGEIYSVSEIRREGLVTEKKYRKILPYVFVGKMNE
jgi:DNA uptake protein ComE-like DNA-binding protein